METCSNSCSAWWCSACCCRWGYSRFSGWRCDDCCGGSAPLFTCHPFTHPNRHGHEINRRTCQSIDPGLSTRKASRNTCALSGERLITQLEMTTAFASVVMPGIGELDDREFIRSFQVIDRIIQRGQPAFGLVWVGSFVTLLLSTVTGVLQLDGIERAFIVVSAIVYVLGVQVPTFRINVPLNNALQRMDVDVMDEDALKSARAAFENRWVRWNAIRTVLASLVSLALMFVLLWL